MIAVLCFLAISYILYAVWMLLRTVEINLEEKEERTKSENTLYSIVYTVHYVLGIICLITFVPMVIYEIGSKISKIQVQFYVEEERKKFQKVLEDYRKKVSDLSGERDHYIKMFQNCWNENKKLKEKISSLEADIDILLYEKESNYK